MPSEGLPAVSKTRSDSIRDCDRIIFYFCCGYIAVYQGGACKVIYYLGGISQYYNVRERIPYEDKALTLAL
jgi:hypothetical protein